MRVFQCPECGEIAETEFNDISTPVCKSVENAWGMQVHKPCEMVIKYNTFGKTIRDIYFPREESNA